MTPATKGPRRSRKPATAAVTACYSIRASMPKMHLRDDCTGLERTPEGMRAYRDFDSLWQLLEEPHTRPCRVCSLADCLVWAVQSEGIPSRGELVTFSSQPAPEAFDGNKLSFAYEKVSDTGSARLFDIASRLSLGTTRTLIGPVAFSRLTARAAAAVEANLRTLRLGQSRGELPPAQAIEVLWTLSVDTPPELSGQPVQSLWNTARLLAK